MTGSADFTAEEWEDIIEGPTAAGTLVALAHRGGSFRESFSMAKAYTEARKQSGASELLDVIVSTKPKVERVRPGSADELAAHVTEKLRAAIGLLQQKATPEEIEDYRQFVVGLAQRVAESHKEDGQAVAPEEQAAIDQITAALA